MNDISVVDELARNRLVPVVVIDDPAHAIPVSEALRAGGIHCAEITLRTPAGLESIRRLADQTDFLVGAGTVVNAGQVDAAVLAGARFVVSPGLGDDVVQRARELGISGIPGIATATELQHAVRLGLTAVKLFPAGQLGGPAAVFALAARSPARASCRAGV